MNKISIFHFTFFTILFTAFAFSANNAYAQGLSDEDDEWETETLDALQPIWIQSRATPVNTKNTLPSSEVNRPRIAISGAQLPIVGKKENDAKIVAESTGTIAVKPIPLPIKPAPAPAKPAVVEVRSRPMSMEKTIVMNISTNVGTMIVAPATKKEINIQLPENSMPKTDLILNAPKEAVIAPILITDKTVYSKPLAIDKKAMDNKADLAISANIIAPKTEKTVVTKLPEATIPNGTLLAAVNLESLSREMPKTTPKTMPKTIEAVKLTATKPVEIQKEADNTAIKTAVKPIKTAAFSPIPASKPGFAMAASQEDLTIAPVEKTEETIAEKAAQIKTAKLELPTKTRIEANEPKINVPANIPIKSGVASAKLIPKASVAAKRVTTAELEGENRQSYAQAYEEFRVSNYAQAAPFLKEIIVAEPRFADGYRMLVECEEKQGNYKKAITYYQKYLEFFPNNEKDWFNLSLLYSKIKDMDRAVEACKRSIDINPDYEKGKRRLVNLYATTGRTEELAAETTDEGIFKYALVLYKQKKLVEAIERVNMMQTPTTDGHYLRGICYRKLNQDDNAIAAYNQAIALNPAHFDAITELGILYYNQTKYAEACEHFGKATSMKTSDMELAMFYGRALVFNKEPKRAISYLEKAVAANPKDLDARRFLAYAYLAADKQYDNEEAKAKVRAEAPTGLAESTTKTRNQFYNEGVKLIETGDYAAAIPKFEQAEKEDSREPRIFYMKGLAYFNLKDYSKAITAFTKTTKIDASYTKAYEGLAKAYYQQEDGDKAAENYELAIQKGGATLSNYSELAAIYAFTNQSERAALYFEKAIGLAPQNAELRFNYGTTFLNTNQFNKAIEQLKKAAEISPKYWAAYYNIGQVYLKQEKLDEAMAVGEKLIAQNPQYANGYALCAIVCNKRGDSYNQEKYAKQAKKLDPSLPFD